MSGIEQWFNQSPPPARSVIPSTYRHLDDRSDLAPKLLMGFRMMKQVAVALALTLVPLVAHAQEAQTETAQTLVVVTPNAPTVVVTGGGGAAPSAAPGAAEAPPAAPQTEAWSDVSHINGQLVKVGEHGDYLYKMKKTNIGTNPIGMMFGFYGFSIQHAVSQNVAVRGDISAWSISNGSFSGVEVSAGLPIYFRRTYSGPFFEPGLVYHSDSHGCYDCSYSSGSSYDNTHTWVGPQMMVGWSWIFDSGLNLAFAFGASKPISNTNNMSYSSSNDPYPAGYFRIGYAF
jgi:hypothetical protein